MPAEFESGFFVREPAWHGLGVVLEDYPGREEAMRLAGHDFTIVERPITVGHETEPEGQDVVDALGALPQFSQVPAKGWKALVKECPEELAHEDESHGQVMQVTRESYTVIQNDVGWDIVDAIIGEGAKYETGLTLKGGAICSVLAWLDEPVQVPGDDSPTLPFLNVSWTHDGSGALSSRATSVRVVCWNTLGAAEAEGKARGTDFTFRHTKNVKARIEDAKMAIQGVRESHQAYMDLACELAEMPVTKEQRELFVTSFLPMPPDALISERVKSNVEEARGEVRALFSGKTIPEAHELTAYGLQLAGVEYLDHLRGYRNAETYYGRSMLRPEPAKAKLTGLIRDVVAA